MSDVSDLAWTIVPKSDQLNAEQLLSGPRTIRITDVRAGSDEQPVTIHYEGDDGRPYKPCKTMRKVLIFAWGGDGRAWIGRSLTLYNDPKIKFGGMEVGGIRISHMSDIPQRVQVALTATKGKKAMCVIDVLKPDAAKPASVDYLVHIAGAETVADAKDAFAAAWRSTRDEATRAHYKAAFDARMREIGSSLEQS